MLRWNFGFSPTFTQVAKPSVGGSPPTRISTWPCPCFGTQPAPQRRRFAADEDLNSQAAWDSPLSTDQRRRFAADEDLNWR